MWLALLGLVLACLSGLISLWNYLGLRERPKKSELSQLLVSSSETLLTEYGRKLRSLETEWDDMYEKFTRLAGRMDRRARAEGPKVIEDAPPPVPRAASRSDLIRSRRNNV